MSSPEQDSDSIERGEEAVERGKTVLTYGDRAVSQGDALLAAYGKTTVLKQPARTPNSDEDESEVETWCGPPRDVSFVVPGASDDEFRSVLGTVAERIINQDFCERTNCQPFLEPDSLDTDYFDTVRGGRNMFVHFLDMHNEHITRDDLRKQRRLKRPDILTHKPERKDYYEIKPNSRSGIESGRKKLRKIAKFVTEFRLPYESGTTFTPTGEIEIGTVNLEGVPIDVFLRVKRHQPALLVYDYCMRGELEKANRKLAKRVRRVALLGFLLSSLIPVDTPIRQPGEEPEQPGEDPVPQPEPMPVPAAGRDDASDIPLIVPRPDPGPTPEEFTFRYVRGLPKHPTVGEAYPIVISYESQEKTYRTVVEFRVSRIEDNVRKLTSTNTTQLNIAPVDHDPLIIEVENEMTVTWHEQ